MREDGHNEHMSVQDAYSEGEGHDSKSDDNYSVQGFVERTFPKIAKGDVPL